MAVRLDVATVLERVFALYRRRAALLLPAALIVFVPVAVIQALILAGSTSIFLIVLLEAVAFVGTFIYQGIVVETVAETRASSEHISLGHLFKVVQPRLGALMLTGLLYGFGVAIGFLLLIVPGLIALTLWAVVAPVVLLERRSATAAFGRSRELVRGNAWRVFSVVVVITVITLVIQQILQRIGGNHLVAHLLLLLVASVITAPLSALAATIMYFDLLGETVGVTAAAGAPAPSAAGGWEASGGEPHGDYYADAGGAGAEPADASWGEPAATEGHPGQAAEPAWEPAADSSAHTEPTVSQPVQHPADWYPDPRGEARLRYWDGSAWTSYTAD